MYAFPKSLRLQNRDEFTRVLDRGTKVVSPDLVVFKLPRRDADSAQHPRLGLIVSRKVGGAVTRNRVKRKLREAFRLKCPELTEDPRLNPYDIVVIARPKAAEQNGARIPQSLSRCLSRLARKNEASHPRHERSTS